MSNHTSHLGPAAASDAAPHKTRFPHATHEPLVKDLHHQATEMAQAASKAKIGWLDFFQSQSGNLHQGVKRAELEQAIIDICNSHRISVRTMKPFKTERGSLVPGLSATDTNFWEITGTLHHATESAKDWHDRSWTVSFHLVADQSGYARSVAHHEQCSGWWTKLHAKGRDVPVVIPALVGHAYLLLGPQVDHHDGSHRQRSYGMYLTSAPTRQTRSLLELALMHEDPRKCPLSIRKDRLQFAVNLVQGLKLIYDATGILASSNYDHIYFDPHNKCVPILGRLDASELANNAAFKTDAAARINKVLEGLDSKYLDKAKIALCSKYASAHHAQREPIKEAAIQARTEQLRRQALASYAKYLMGTFGSEPLLLDDIIRKHTQPNTHYDIRHVANWLQEALNEETTPKSSTKPSPAIW